jgi:chemotaxis protein MotB
MGLSQQKNRYRVNELENTNMDEWLNTYSDMITLLMAFFIVVISVSKVDLALWEQIKKGLRSEIMKDKDVKTPLAEIKHDLDSLLEDERKKEMVAIDLNREGIFMQFSSSTFYAPGKADIGENAQKIIDKVSASLTDITYYDFAIDIEGHTDNVSIHTLRFPSNWELSVARATNIVKYFIEKGIDPDRLKAAGYADTKPIVPHTDEQGKDIPENQAKNRRIVIRIH